MPKKIITPLLALAFVLHACKKEAVNVVEKEIYQAVQFHITEAQKYSASLEVRIHLKIVTTTPSNPDGTVWDTMVSKQPIPNLFKTSDTLIITHLLPVSHTENTKFSGQYAAYYYSQNDIVWYSSSGQTLMRGADTSRVLVKL